MRIALILTAAGNSTRFGENKLHHSIQGTPILTHAANSLSACPNISQKLITIPSAEDTREYSHLAQGFTPIIGGKTRAHSVRNAVAALEPCDGVLIHDAARPYIPQLVIHTLVQSATEGCQVVIPALPLTDTIKEVQDNHVVKTLDRTRLVAVQTPQLISFPTLTQLYRSLSEEALERATDEAMLCEQQGLPVHVVPGDPIMRKITTPTDLIILNALLERA